MTLYRLIILNILNHSLYAGSRVAVALYARVRERRRAALAPLDLSAFEMVRIQKGDWAIVR